MNFIMVEDHNLVCKGVCKIIEEKSDFKCIGTFSTVEDAKRFLNDYTNTPPLSIINIQPIICIVDINLGHQEDNEEDGFSLIKYITKHFHNINCICYSMFKGAGIVEKAISLGALGYVSKNADLSVLLKAMQHASQNKVYIEENLTSDYVVYTNLFNSLTKREKELTELYLQGKNDDQISVLMNISKRAINNYWTRILSKLGVASKKELIDKYQ